MPTTNARLTHDSAAISRRLGWMSLAGSALVALFWLLYFTGAVGVAAEGAAGSLESAFVLADALLALTLLAAGRALLQRRPAGAFLLVAGASMCVYLGALDLTIYASHGARGALTTPVLLQLVASALCLAGGALGIRFGWALWREG